jgi:hypothetical protein
MNEIILKAMDQIHVGHDRVQGPKLVTHIQSKEAKIS